MKDAVKGPAATRDAKASVRAVLHSVNDILVLAEPFLSEVWQQMGMTFLQVRVLRRLRILGETSAGELAEAVGVSPASLTRILARLEEKALVERQIDRVDRRRVVVAITREGRGLVGERGLLSHTIFESAAEAMTESERQALVKQLGMFARHLDRMRVEPAEA